MLVKGGTAPVGHHHPVACLLIGNDVWVTPCVLQANLCIKRCPNNLDFAWRLCIFFSHQRFWGGCMRAHFFRLPGQMVERTPVCHLHITKTPRPCEGWTSFIWSGDQLRYRKRTAFSFHWYLQVLLLFTIKRVYLLLHRGLLSDNSFYGKSR